MKRFIHSALVDKENFLNLEKERDLLISALIKGERIVIYGRRDTGKTSLIKNIAIPLFKKKNKSCFVLYVDFMEVKNLEAIHHRVRLSFQRAFAETFPSKRKLSATVDLIKNLRPSINIDPLGGFNVTIEAANRKESIEFMDIFRELQNMIKNDIKVALIMDEFQDIAMVEQAQGLFRSAIQELSVDMPIIILGSKQHLLSKIFAQPNAPFAGWGKDLQIGKIPHEEFFQYMQERFVLKNISIDFDTSRTLQNQMQRIPEPINMVCDHIFNYYSEGTEVNSSILSQAIAGLVENRASRYEQFLSTFTHFEENILTLISKEQPVRHILGKAFLSKTDASAKGVDNIIKRLENKALIYHEKEGYVMADPLLSHYLCLYR